MRTISDEPYISIDGKVKSKIFYTDNVSFKFDVPKLEKVKKKKKIKTYPKQFKIKRDELLRYARLNYGCTKCGVFTCLQVHHKDKDKFNNSDDNLVVLCYYCHALEHKHM